VLNAMESGGGMDGSWGTGIGLPEVIGVASSPIQVFHRNLREGRGKKMLVFHD
jgi:hypothetical protein